MTESYIFEHYNLISPPRVLATFTQIWRTVCSLLSKSIQTNLWKAYYICLYIIKYFIGIHHWVCSPGKILSVMMCRLYSFDNECKQTLSWAIPQFHQSEIKIKKSKGTLNSLFFNQGTITTPNTNTSSTSRPSQKNTHTQKNPNNQN